MNAQTATVRCSHCGYVNHSLLDNCQGCGRALSLADIGFQVLRQSTAQRSDDVNAWVARKWEAQAKTDSDSQQLYKAVRGFIMRTNIVDTERGRVAVRAQELAEGSIGLGMNRGDVLASPAAFVAEACRRLGVPAYRLLERTDAAVTKSG